MKKGNAFSSIPTFPSMSVNIIDTSDTIFANVCLQFGQVLNFVVE